MFTGFAFCMPDSKELFRGENRNTRIREMSRIPCYQVLSMGANAGIVLNSVLKIINFRINALIDYLIISRNCSEYIAHDPHGFIRLLSSGDLADNIVDIIVADYRDRSSNVSAFSQ